MSLWLLARLCTVNAAYVAGNFRERERMKLVKAKDFADCWTAYSKIFTSSK